MSDQSPPADAYPSSHAPAPALPKETYTPWLTRVLAALIDAIPVLVIQGIALGVLLGTRETVCVNGNDVAELCAESTSTMGQLSYLLLGVLVPLAYLVWNYGYRQGITGQSVGKSVMRFQVVSEKTWHPIGFGMSLVRQLAHVFDQVICYIGYLLPLWDAKRQTLADKIMTTVCVPEEPAPPPAGSSVRRPR